MQMRARAFALSDAFLDVLRGVNIAEEDRDMPVEKDTFEQVCEMRELHERRGKGYGTLVMIFACGQSTARNICTYRTRISA